MLLKDWKGPQSPLTFEELYHDDLTPSDKPNIDLLILGKDGDKHYAELGEELEKYPISSAGIRRS